MNYCQYCIHYETVCQENIRRNGVGYGQSVEAFIEIHEESWDVEEYHLHIFYR